MSRIVYRPAPEPRAPRMRTMIGFRLAGLHAEGTVVEDRRGVRWRSWRPETYAEMDMAPAWIEVIEESA